MADDTKLSSTDASTTKPMTGSRLYSGNPVTESLRVAVVGPEEVLETKPLANEIQNLLTTLGHDVETMLAARTAWEPSPRVGSTSSIAHDADLVIVLGGDGSILRTARWMGTPARPTRRTHTLTHSHTPSLPPSLARSLARSLTHTHSLTVGGVHAQSSEADDGAKDHGMRDGSVRERSHSLSADGTQLL